MGYTLNPEAGSPGRAEGWRFLGSRVMIYRLVRKGHRFCAVPRKVTNTSPRLECRTSGERLQRNLKRDDVWLMVYYSPKQCASFHQCQVKPKQNFRASIGQVNPRSPLSPNMTSPFCHRVALSTDSRNSKCPRGRRRLSPFFRFRKTLLVSLFAQRFALSRLHRSSSAPFLNTHPRHLHPSTVIQTHHRVPHRECPVSQACSSYRYSCSTHVLRSPELLHLTTRPSLCLDAGPRTLRSRRQLGPFSPTTSSSSS